MDFSHRIQAKTDNGDTAIDFLIEVMQGERDGFKTCHRLAAARLLTKYGCSCKSAVAERDEAITAEELAGFHSMIDTKIKRRKQVAEERKRRAREEAEREAQQAKARAEAQARAESEPDEPPDPGPPPTHDEHKRWSPTPNIPTSFRLVKCGHSQVQAARRTHLLPRG